MTDSGCWPDGDTAAVWTVPTHCAQFATMPENIPASSRQPHLSPTDPCRIYCGKLL